MPDARHLYAQLLDAWNARDADAFARLFAADGTSIGFDGSVSVGDEIAEHLRPIFADHPTGAYLARVRAVRPLGAGAELLRAIAGMVPPGADAVKPEVNALHTVVVEDDHIVLFQNTAAQYHGRPEATQKHTAEIEAVRAAGVTLQ